MKKRNIYLDNTPLDEALERFIQTLMPHIAVKSEKVRVIESVDRVTAEPVTAKLNSPFFDSAAMDGIAVISSHTHGASEAVPLNLKLGRDFTPVDTGDPVLPPYDAVIMIEDIFEIDESTCVIRSAAPKSQHIRPIGEDIKKGEVILHKGHKVRPVDIGALLASGNTDVNIIKLPTVAIIPTGSELIEPGVTPKVGDIIESNSWMLEALVKKQGGIPKRYRPIEDKFEIIKEVLLEASQAYDVVMIIAGTSAGREDFTSQVIQEIGEVDVHGVAVKPGKPVMLATILNKPVIGIPGYPVSAYLTFENFVKPVLRMLRGESHSQMPKTVKAVLSCRIVSSLKHSEFIRVSLKSIENRMVATPLPRGAGASMSLVKADGFCIIPRDIEGVEAGTEVEVIIDSL